MFVVGVGISIDVDIIIVCVDFAVVAIAGPSCTGLARLGRLWFWRVFKFALK